MFADYIIADRQGVAALGLVEAAVKKLPAESGHYCTDTAGPAVAVAVTFFSASTFDNGHGTLSWLHSAGEYNKKTLTVNPVGKKGRKECAAPEPHQMTILQANEITKQYRIGNRDITVLDSVTLEVAPGEFLVVKGESGSGKSTLLAILSGLDRPERGRVSIEGRDITDLDEDALAPIRNNTFGFVFQSFHLVPSLSALENVMFPAELKGDKEARTKALALLDRVGLAHRVDSYPHQLSGGEKQRCAICRSLINNPRIIFADEPTGNLDSVNGEAVLALLLELQRERGTTMILVTHSAEIAGSADRVITLKDGRIVTGADHA